MDGMCVFFLTVVTFIALFTSLDAGERTTCFNGVYSTTVKLNIEVLNLGNTIIIIINNDNINNNKNNNDC